MIPNVSVGNPEVIGILSLTIDEKILVPSVKARYDSLFKTRKKKKRCDHDV